MNDGRHSNQKEPPANGIQDVTLRRRLRAIRDLVANLRCRIEQLAQENEGLKAENARLRSENYQLEQALAWANLRLSWATEEPEVPADFGFLKTVVNVLPSPVNGHKNGNGAANGYYTNGHSEAVGSARPVVEVVADRASPAATSRERAVVRTIDGPTIARVWVEMPPLQTADAFGRMRRVWRFQLAAGDLRSPWSARAPLLLCLPSGEAHQVLVSAINFDESADTGMLESLPAPRPWSRSERAD